MKRPRGTFIIPRTEVDLALRSGLAGRDPARGVVHDVVAGSFRRTGVRLSRPALSAADRGLLPPR
jgi:hypothetical protein